MDLDQKMKNCVWLKPELVAQIEFAEWIPDGLQRHSKFVGLRDDRDAREVVRGDQKLVMAPKHYRGLGGVGQQRMAI